MADDEDILNAVARDGSMDYTKWPELLQRILPRLDHIVHNEFPIPSIPTSGPLPNLENSQRDPRGPVTPTPDSQTSSITALDQILPPPIQALHAYINKTLSTSFTSYPPHTIQRLSELLLNPTSHYRTLPSYLRALDRVVSVSSTANVFPLPLLASSGADPTTNGINGTNSYFAPHAPIGGLSQSVEASSDDDSLSGAVLTPISWLRNTNASPLERAGDLRTESTSLIDGPNGVGGVETVTVSMGSMARTGPVTPANVLLSQHATDGGILPMGRQTRSTSAAAATAMAKKEDDTEEAEEIVHARGPEEIGMEDMGPQATGTSGRGKMFDVEAALGRRGEGEKIDHSGGKMTVVQDTARRDDQDADGDTLIGDQSSDRDRFIVDADGRVEGENQGEDRSGKNAGADAIDTTAL